MVDAYLTMRGLKTLVLRMQRHSENASAVAEFLAEHPSVSAVLYPGLPAHPGHQVACFNPVPVDEWGRTREAATA